jgi:translation initiation factor 3 subunit L
VYEDLFQYACPKFISPNGPNFDDPASLTLVNVRNFKTPVVKAHEDILTLKNHFQEPYQHHAKIFLSDIHNQTMIPTLRSFLKLYTTMSIDKLAAFLEMDADELRTQLLIFKQRSRQQKWTTGNLLEGDVVSTSDLDFCIKQDMIHIAESKVGRRYGDWFLRNITRFQDVIATLEQKN